MLDGITPVGYKVTVTINNTPKETIFAAYEGKYLICFFINYLLLLLFGFVCFSKGVQREIVAFANAIKSGKAEPYASAVEGLIDVSLVWLLTAHYSRIQL